jgi:hypothetical protein
MHYVKKLKDRKMAEENPSLGSLVNYSDEELNQAVLERAKYFTVVQINRGGFVAGGKNYNRTEYPTLEKAQEEGEKLYKAEGKAILIYAVADWPSIGFSRPIDSFPRSTWKSKADKERDEKKRKADARELARQARLSLGSKKKKQPES